MQVIQEALDGLEQVSKRIMARVGPLDRLICKACYKEYAPRSQERHTYNKKDGEGSIYCLCRRERLEKKCR